MLPEEGSTQGHDNDWIHHAQITHASTTKMAGFLRRCGRTRCARIGGVLGTFCPADSSTTRSQRVLRSDCRMGAVRRRYRDIHGK